ncbi:hypothetical protein D9611_013678 [Ephemerocybe angulata]|uniref:Uncharacterized protein n=1 Tax=Ephemerocybe angulata TaxID=980116 RepID=A0A8H5F0M7_9AGAR|nr:hypothetical protein D9611_013678 [Tulosesus angulatus]
MLQDQDLYREEALGTANGCARPLLESAMYEAIRTGTVAPPARTAARDSEVMVDGKPSLLKKGVTIIAESPEYHFDPEAFNVQRRSCKGIHLAKPQIKSFMTMVLKRFDLQVVGSEQVVSQRAGLV